MKVLALLAMCTLISCAQNKAKSSAPAAVPIQSGLTCKPDGETLTTGAIYNWGNGTTLYQGDKSWTVPAGQIWHCDNGHWARDTAAEQAEAARLKLVGTVRAQIATRKLTKEEIGVIGEATYHALFSGSCGSDGCDAQFCSYEAMRSAELIGQLSFWHPTEDQLPLAMLQSYLKGMRCDGGAQRAYQIMNGRIMAWLEAQVK